MSKSKIIAILSLLYLFSCGFQVIYLDKENSSSYINDLAAIRIQKDRGRLSQELRNNLYDTLNPGHIKVKAKYLLILNIKESTTSIFITSTGASGRNKIALDIDYQLKGLKKAELISSGTTSVNDSYDVNSNRYGTYVTEEYTKKNLVKIVAQNIRDYLVNDLIKIQENKN